MNMDKPFALTLLLSILLAGTAVNAEMYRYTDASGQVIYSQFKPADDDNVVTIDPPPPPPSSAANSRQQLVERLQQEQDKKQDQQKQAEADQKTQAEKDRKRNNCEAARKNLKTLQNSSSRQRIMDKDGKEMKMDDRQRQQKIREAQDMVRKNR